MNVSFNLKQRLENRLTSHVVHNIAVPVVLFLELLHFAQSSDPFNYSDALASSLSEQLIDHGCDASADTDFESVVQLETLLVRRTAEVVSEDLIEALTFCGLYFLDNLKKTSAMDSGE